MRKVLYSLLLFFFSITNTLHSQCHYLMYMYDSYGDGWNSAYLEVNMNGTFVGNFDCSQSFTLDSSTNRLTLLDRFVIEWSYIHVILYFIYFFSIFMTLYLTTQQHKELRE